VNAKQIWQTALERLRTKVTPAVYTTWFQGTTALSFQDGVFVVSTPSPFARAQLAGRFLEPIRSALSDIIGSPVEVEVVVTKESSDEPGEAANDEPGSGQQRTRRLRGRPPAAQRRRRIADIAAAAVNSLVSVTSHAEARHNEESEALAAGDDGSGVAVIRENAQTDGEVAPEMAGVYIGEGALNPRYTFGAFIVGKSNQLAHAASFAVSENPGHIYNPLFLYGGVGLGKTHLLHAIGHVGESAGLTVLYVTSEKFTNEIINAIRFQKTEEFRAKYRQIDILLVDDIQFIAGKESTEEEFFHTFNSLHNASKQIVVTSDRPPKAIHSLQDRLRSRFEWGLLADIQPPEYEHRLAILRSKAESLHFAVPNSVIEYIARPECSSVRELEGALNRVIAYATLHDAPLTVGLAAQALEHIYSDKRPPSTLTVSEVLEGVCRYYNVEAALIKGKQRDREIVWPRQVAMYLMREETSASLLQIGTELGGRDHTTIMHGWEKVQTEIANNDRVRQEIAAVLESLQRREV
jgi:chromosomal replication initiator protein